MTNDMRGEGHGQGDEEPKVETVRGSCEQTVTMYIRNSGDKMGSKHDWDAFGCAFESHQNCITDKASSQGFALPLPCIISTISNKKKKRHSRPDLRSLSVNSSVCCVQLH